MLEVAMIEEWRKYLRAYRIQETDEYHYPAMDYTTDTGFFAEKWAKEKHQREQAAALECLESDWRITIDFGCGAGGHFGLLNPVTQTAALLIGIEPDRQRAEWAQKSATDLLANASCEIINSGVEVLEAAPTELQVDQIVCCQVLGHTPTAHTRKIVEAFTKVLRPGGHVALAVPVVGPHFKDHSTADGWDGTGDYCHLVDVRHINTAQFRRTFRDLELFDRCALSSEELKLPVRCFLIPDFPDPSRIEYPCPTETPPTIFNLVKGDFEILSAAIYHQHDPAIGDAMIHLRKS